VPARSSAALEGAGASSAAARAACWARSACSLGWPHKQAALPPALGAALVHAGGASLAPSAAPPAAPPQGYGTSCLDSDADELLQLLQHLHQQRGSTALALLGHSTGAQDAVRLVARHRASLDALPFKGLVLQAPVGVRWAALGGAGRRWAA
jgi:pimeloyl-ACP methyl ester carboxylesterase